MQTQSILGLRGIWSNITATASSYCKKMQIVVPGKCAWKRLQEEWCWPWASHSSRSGHVPPQHDAMMTLSSSLSSEARVLRSKGWACSLRKSTLGHPSNCYLVLMHQVWKCGRNQCLRDQGFMGQPEIKLLLWKIRIHWLNSSCDPFAVSNFFNPIMNSELSSQGFVNLQFSSLFMQMQLPCPPPPLHPNIWLLHPIPVLII